MRKIKKAWSTSDGYIFEDYVEAADHEALLALTKWVTEHLIEGMTHATIAKVLLEHRGELAILLQEPIEPPEPVL